jgi:hypothetical protein
MIPRRWARTVEARARSIRCDTRLGRDVALKILDFELAKIAVAVLSGDEETVKVRTEPDVVMGKAGYMFPERQSSAGASRKSESVIQFSCKMHLG